MAYTSYNLPSLAESLRLLREQNNRPLITPIAPGRPAVPAAPWIAPAPTIHPSAFAEGPLPRVPVSSRAATELTPEQMRAIQGTSRDERMGNILQVLGLIGMAFNPFVGALAVREGRRREQRGLGAKVAAVKQAEETEKLKADRAAMEREQTRLWRQHLDDLTTNRRWADITQEHQMWERGPRFAWEKEVAEAGAKRESARDAQAASEAQAKLDLLRQGQRQDLMLGMAGLEEQRRGREAEGAMEQLLYGLSAREQTDQEKRTQATIETTNKEIDIRRKQAEAEIANLAAQTAKLNAAPGTPAAQVDKSSIKLANDMIANRVQDRMKQAVETDPLLGTTTRVPALLLDSMWAEEAAGVGETLQMGNLVPRRNKRAQDLRSSIDKAQIAGTPYEQVRSNIAKQMGTRITPAEAQAAFEYLNYVYGTSAKGEAKEGRNIGSWFKSLLSRD